MTGSFGAWGFRRAGGKGDYSRLPLLLRVTYKIIRLKIVILVALLIDNLPILVLKNRN
jgi:hypothetical protein